MRQGAGSSLVSLAGAALAGGGGLLITWFAALALDADQAGAFFTSTSLFLLLATVAKLGTPTAAVYFINRERALYDVYRHSFLPPAVCSLFASAALLVFADRFPDPDIARVLAVFLPLAVVTDILLSVTRGFHSMGPTVLVDKIGRTALQVALLGAVAFTVRTPEAAAAAWVVPYLPASIMAAWALHRMPSPRYDAALPAREYWSFTGPRAAASVVQIALQRLDIVLVAALAGLKAAALYTVATRFLVVGQMVSGAIGQALQPRIAANLSRPARLTALYQESTGWIIALTWPLYLAIALLADRYLGLFGAEYQSPEARLTIWILVPAIMIASSCGIVDTVLAMAGKTSWQFYNVSLALAVNTALNLALIPSLSIVGAAVAWSAALLAKNLLPVLQLRHRGHRPWNGGTVRLMLGLLAAFALTLALGRISPLLQDVGTLLALGLWGIMTVGYTRRTLTDSDPRRHHERKKAARHGQELH